LKYYREKEKINEIENKLERDKKLKELTFPEISFKCKKKKLQESFYLLHRDYNKSKDHEWLRNVKSKEKFQLKYDSRIIKDSADRIFIIIPEPLKVKMNVNVVENQDNKIRMAAIDPGVRTFSTLYDNNGKSKNRLTRLSWATLAFLRPTWSETYPSKQEILLSYLQIKYWSCNYFVSNDQNDQF